VPGNCRENINPEDTPPNPLNTTFDHNSEHGESNFLKILQDNLRGQLSKLEEFDKKFRNSDVYNQIDEKVRERLIKFLYYKGDSLSRVVMLLGYSPLIVDNNQIFMDHGPEKVPAFPNIDKQRDILSQLQRCSQSLASLF